MSAPERIEGARVGVIGLARSGTAVARLLAERGARVYASDAERRDETRGSAAALLAAGIDVEIGGHDRGRLAACDWIVVSPGVPPSAPILLDPAIAGRPIYSEIEVASWLAAAPIAAITGTNGKTTTTALLGAIAREGGLDVAVAGNIGEAFSAAVRERRTVDWYVLEVSSFQLARIATFRPRVAVVLNVAPDHLDVYPDLEAYVADKRRILENMGPEDDLVLNREDPVVADFAGDARAGPALHWFDRTGNLAAKAGTGATADSPRRGAAVVDGWIALVDEPGEGRILPVDRLGIPGAHNVQNALAATAAAARRGVGPEAIARALATFPGVPHRLETVAEEDGVRFVNDSKATNVESTVVAIEAFDAPLVVILGGRHKGSPYARLLPGLEARARRVLAIGEAADRIAGELGGVVDVEVAGTLERAVERAREIARPGDVVLLSPACSSYDQFENYERRGDAFRDLARRAVCPPGGAR
ncbi:MAG TPA: UDP-N-acetylmuramoyl-L-alanine--D-glutamate ligase [Gemmatimonadota bacterium]|nr:UDP-N-acetylmuramoyl-L-alanine--D-glutamate ligase [Gemmatimonadota bacterium]